MLPIANNYEFSLICSVFNIFFSFFFGRKNTILNRNMPRNSADEEWKKSIEYMSDKIDELSKSKQGNLTNFSNGHKIAENRIFININMFLSNVE